MRSVCKLFYYFLNKLIDYMKFEKNVPDMKYFSTGLQQIFKKYINYTFRTKTTSFFYVHSLERFQFGSFYEKEVKKCVCNIKSNAMVNDELSIKLVKLVLPNILSAIWRKYSINVLHVFYLSGKL